MKNTKASLCEVTDKKRLPSSFQCNSVAIYVYITATHIMFIAKIHPFIGGIGHRIYHMIAYFYFMCITRAFSG